MGIRFRSTQEDTSGGGAKEDQARPVTISAGPVMNKGLTSSGNNDGTMPPGDEKESEEAQRKTQV